MISSLFLSLAEFSIMWKRHNLFIHSPIDGNLDHCQVLAIMRKLYKHSYTIFCGDFYKYLIFLKFFFECVELSCYVGYSLCFINFSGRWRRSQKEAKEKVRLCSISQKSHHTPWPIRTFVIRNVINTCI